MTDDRRRHPRHIHRTDLQFEPWANGQGQTSTIAFEAAAPGERSRWRLSLALLRGSSTYNPLEQTDRIFTVMGEHGVALTIDHTRRRCKPGEPVDFTGEMTPFCVATRQTTALNVMVHRGRTVATVTHREVTKSKPVRIDGHKDRLITAVFMMRGSGEFASITMLPGDTVISSEGSGTLRGQGKVILVTVDPKRPKQSASLPH